ncbi:hypothetical protein [Ellagibacter isourolithinifaciens]|uniref:hypothetical protein n=1 Tax=Ellagibacter isourolithinifaciens TaxID=2137581 RepID=UPI003AAFB9D3
MSENASAAEWLRGIADKYEAEAEDGIGCRERAKLFGIRCGGADTCQECRTKELRVIADRIDAERALPEGVEWPRFEVGELVKAGDEVEYGGEAMRVRSVTFVANGWSLRCERRGVDGVLYGSFGERVKRPAPKVLDADGVSIKVGDTVYCNGEDKPLMVSHIVNSTKVTLIDDRVSYFVANPSRLSHERPDSWERIEEDAKLAPRDYLEKCGMNPEKTERIASMMADLVRRAKALAKAGEQG